MNTKAASSDRWTRRGASLVALVFLAVGCAGSSPGGGPSPSSPPGRAKSIPALKLAVLDAVGGRIDYCDPDEYPVPHGSPEENARQRLPEIKKDREAFAAILEHQNLSPDQEFTDDELIAISDDYKQIQAIQLQPSGDGYRFTVAVRKSLSRTGNELVGGTVSRTGVVKIEQRRPGEELNCPICLAGGVRISTPSGDVLVEEVAVGMPVWTTDTHGRRIIGIVMSTGRTHAPRGHRMVRITLADGRAVLASPGHPTMDGRTAGDLRAGDRFDGSLVVSSILVAYRGAMTYDILPSGPTGGYFANGVLLGSTLATRPGTTQATGRPLASVS